MNGLQPNGTEMTDSRMAGLQLGGPQQSYLRDVYMDDSSDPSSHETESSTGELNGLNVLSHKTRSPTTKGKVTNLPLSRR